MRQGKGKPVWQDDGEENEAALLRAMCEGSTEAFHLFYARYAPLVLRIACRTLGERMEAEDACHDVFLEAIRKGDRYNPAKGSVESWLAVMTRSRCVDRLRKRSRTVAMSAENGGEKLRTDTTPEDKTIGFMERMAVREALEVLPELQRNAVVTAFLGKRTQRELAEEWQVPLGTVKSWIRYGLGNLRKELARRGWTDGSMGRRERE
ncbi:RNA polymerase sigma factor [Paenibacillus harenae]|uniref:RNA polymerase sigma factor n=1 Tax=Paenibacillus harenae TaxID=306543 RepID=UPI00278D22D9|nr:sigma-70 family RNA polymerase sigma factor [Paenibacillus harenae]MDQ0064056.1 RNA polymerase sigma-70 factor (ECF subfamily) [Paenibacillus harenae]